MHSVWEATRGAARIGFAEFLESTTPLTWLVGWLSRTAAQVYFYVLLGRFLGVSGGEYSFLVGATVTIAITEILQACMGVSRDHRRGVLSGLMASPAPLGAILVGRSAHLIVQGAAAAALFFVIGNLSLLGRFDPAMFGAYCAVLALTVITSYGLALTVSLTVIRFPSMRSVVAGLVASVHVAVTGATIPLHDLPGWARTVGHLLPATHGLTAVRDAVGVAPSNVAPAVLLSVVTGAAWYVVFALYVVRLQHVARAHRPDVLDG